MKKESSRFTASFMGVVRGEVKGKSSTRDMFATVANLMLCMILFSSCAENENQIGPMPSNPDIQASGTNISVPGDTILYSGQTYPDSIALDHHDLMGIMRNGRAYLYHSAMGSVDFSDSLSEHAVGYFFAWEAASQGISCYGQGERTLHLDDELSTGIRITASEEQQFLIENLKRRFGAIRYGTGQRRFLAQRGDIIDLDWVRWMSGGNLVEFMRESSITQTIVSDQIGTFGATVRVAGTTIWPLVVLKNVDAIQKGADVGALAQVNWVDYDYFLLSGVSRCIGVLPLPVGDRFGQIVAEHILGVGMDAAQAIMISALTHSDQITKEEFSRFTTDTFNDWALTVAALSNPGALAAKEFLDIVFAVGWVIDDILISEYDILTTTAFATMELASPSGITIEWDNNIVNGRQGGSVLWQYDVNTNATGVFWPNADYAINKVLHEDLDNDQVWEVVVVARHRMWYPCQVIVLDERNGNVLGHYWNPGHLNALVSFDINSDGNQEIVLGGGNNDADHPSVLALPPKNFSGQAPPYMGNAPYGNHIWYTYLPPLSGDVQWRNFVDALDVSIPNRIIARDLDTPYNYQLDYNGNIVGGP